MSDVSDGLKLIRNGIINNNLQTICDGYNKITKENIKIDLDIDVSDILTETNTCDKKLENDRHKLIKKLMSHRKNKNSRKNLEGMHILDLAYILQDLISEDIEHNENVEFNTKIIGKTPAGNPIKAITVEETEDEKFINRIIEQYTNE
ncbi:MAG: hypothetical protein BAJALOKI3v1_50094 [Promethearchaeota archaeon]|nr:MAG: hypothetical protein BAJALOKI3v1_50094 [Candidatus Lokiarchaeota archaeon]